MECSSVDDIGQCIQLEHVYASSTASDVSHACLMTAGVWHLRMAAAHQLRPHRHVLWDFVFVMSNSVVDCTVVGL